jgi:catechol 2,3-dioxygenase-like lactoylglutathione lyase family enzyme
MASVQSDPNFNHTAIWVADLWVMMRFYEEVVGLERRFYFPPPATPAWASYSGLQLLAAPSGTAFESPPATVWSPLQRPALGAFSHIGLGVAGDDDLDELNERLVEHGVEIVIPLVTRQVGDRVARWVFFRDPEGNSVEVMKVD